MSPAEKSAVSIQKQNCFSDIKLLQTFYSFQKLCMPSLKLTGTIDEESLTVIYKSSYI